MANDGVGDRAPLIGNLTLERHVRAIVYLCGALVGVLAVPLNDGPDLYKKANQFSHEFLNMAYADAAAYALIIAGLLIVALTVILASYFVWRIWYRYREGYV